MEIERDPVSGRDTTGHEWDGIKELNTPVPSISKWALRLTIVFAVGYQILFPSWPFVSDFYRGTLGYSSRDVVLDEVAAANAFRAEQDADLLAGNLAQLADNADLRARIEPQAAILARDNCVMCHGRALDGQPGFPNLADDHWLWSGDIEEIATTLRFGINAGHEDTRVAEMLAFGALQMLERPDINATVDYVLSLSEQDHDPALAKTGAAVFEENCAACHGEGGTGGLEVGAPDLTDSVWIYGGDRETIHQTIWYGRRGVMPAWSGRLSEAEIRRLALYVYWTGRDTE